MALFKSNFVNVLVGASLAGVTGVILYFLYGKDEDEVEAVEGIKTSRTSIIEVKIPKDYVGVVIGRGGSNIKEIQEKSDTKINFKDEQEGDTYRVCVIRGTPESAQYAESLVHEFISIQPLVEVSTMFVPQKACGRIIGRNGENIRSMYRASSAKICIDSNTNGKTPLVKITLKGTAEQIELAKSLIHEKVEEDTELRKKMENLNSRSPRRKENNLLSITAEAHNRDGAESPNVEKLIAVGSDGTLEVFVSAVHSPDCFWVQIKGPRAVDLDVLVDQMTEYYSKDENRELHIVEKVQKNMLVAALFSLDNKWYRGKVVVIKEDEYNPENSDVEVYYVDYGDTETVKLGTLLRLRTDFLTLRFQAVECALARVVPIGGSWSADAVNAFDRLVKVARWEAMTARVETTRTKTGLGHGSIVDESTHRPIPCIDLYETRGAQDISVAEELVKMGFAEWKRETPEKKAPEVPKRAEFAEWKREAAENKALESSKLADTPLAASTPFPASEKNIENAPKADANNTSDERKEPSVPEDKTPTSTTSSLSSFDLKPTPRAFLPPDFSDEGSSDELEMV